jgi:hypothetical protein
VPHDGPPGHTLGMLCPQATVAGLVVGQRGAQTHRPLLHVSPEPQRVPAPGQVAPGQVLGMGAPQSTVLAAGHDETHTQRPSVQRWPLGHAVPVPAQAGPPGQRLLMGAPQLTVLAAGHDGSQVQALSTQRWPVGHATPRPQAGPPSHALGISRPQPTWLGSM